jgi:Ni/Co efflux regulator RcnB
MKRAILILTTAALALTSTLASAQGYGDRGGRNDNRGGWDRNDNRGGYNNNRNDRRGGQSWQRGQNLPSQYRGRDRYVSDWGRYRLSAPPRGYGYYRQDNGDFVLAALATGLIANLVAGNQYGGGYGGGYAQPYAYGSPYAAGPAIYRDQYGRAYTIDQYGRSVWVR